MVFHCVLTLKAMTFQGLQGNLRSFCSQGPMAAAGFVSWLGTSDAATLPCAVLPGPHGVYHGLTWPDGLILVGCGARQRRNNHKHTLTITHTLML